LKKILVIQTASIGDVILATPVIEKLHHFFPDSKIDLLVKKGNEGLFAGHPFLNNVIIWNKAKRKYSYFASIFYDIRKNHYDAVINIQRFMSTGLMTAFSGAKIRIGFSKNPFSVFFNTRISHEIHDGIHETDRNLRLIEKLTDGSELKPKLYPSTSDYNKVSIYKSQVYYTISPGSLWFTKQYPKEKWIEFVSRINKDYPVFFLGSNEDHQMCQEIIQLSGIKNAINLSGNLSFLESAALMKDARMNFTNDSAPMHLASSVNAPVTVIYCSTIPDFGFGPLSDQSNIVEIKENLVCRPCGLHGLRSCPEKHFKCALNIETDQLMEHL
jgi:ADP-heptose:LPS heptosyltransferase